MYCIIANGGIMRGLNLRIWAWESSISSYCYVQSFPVFLAVEIGGIETRGRVEIDRVIRIEISVYLYILSDEVLISYSNENTSYLQYYTRHTYSTVIRCPPDG